MSSPLLEFLLNCTSPLTLEDIASQVGRDQHEVEEELESLLRENSIRKRLIKLKSDDNDTNVQYKSIYWTSSLIPFISHEPIITSPFQLPFEHYTVLERLTDQQLQQEKIWLQTKLRKINSEYENLLHRSKLKYTEEDEELLDSHAIKWLNASQEMLQGLLLTVQKVKPETTMIELLKDLRIDPKSVKWNEEDESFET